MDNAEMQRQPEWPREDQAPNWSATRIDPLTKGSAIGTVLSIGLGAAAIFSADFNALLAGGTSSLYDAAIWMAEMCRFD